MILVLACLLMVAQDMFGVAVTVAEARGRAWLAGTLDALYDWPKMLGAGIAGAVLVQHGFARTFALVSAVSLTSFFSTAVATRLAKRIKADP